MMPSRVALVVGSPGELVPRYYPNSSWGGLTLDGEPPVPLGAAVKLRVTVSAPSGDFDLGGRVAWIRRQQTSQLKPGFGIDIGDDASVVWERMLAFARNEVSHAVIRSTRRVPVSLPVQLELAGKTTTETVTDLSSRGAFVRTALALEPGTAVKLTISPPGKTTKISLLGQVRWRRSDAASPGVGVQFIETHSAVAAAVQALTERLALG